MSMPVRRKAIAWLDFAEGLSPEDTYVMLIQSIDWKRVMLEASGRCLTLHSDDIKDDLDIPCAECVEEALLVEDTFPDWMREDAHDTRRLS